MSRPALASRHPVHVTLRLRDGLPNLRRRALAAVVFRAFAMATAAGRVRLVHFSVQHDHLHLIVEARDRVGLSRAIQGLNIRIARRLNARLRRRGAVFADRYHARALTTPLEVRRAILYVVNNYRRHLAQGGERAPGDWVDPLSSANHGGVFVRLADGRRPCTEFGFRTGPPVTAPRTWLLAVGWRRHGLLRVAEIPAERGRERR